ncbi:MAG: nicotinate-nucleotide--dimethylbenzimidazole phosphoribosyltransferase [Bacteroidota bacterium]
MNSFNILPAYSDLKQALQQKIDNKTKPLGALGRLEEIALQVGQIQQTDAPVINQPSLVVFAGDHGIAKHGLVNAFPQAVTHQMVLNFLGKGAAVNVFARQHRMNLYVVDAGVNHDFGSLDGLVDAKIGFGTRNYLEEPAMTEAQCNEAIEKGAAFVRELHAKGCNLVAFGEMGIGNTASASLIMSCLLNLPVDACVGRGAGTDDELLAQKKAHLQKAKAKYDLGSDQPWEILQTFGGFELAMITGGILAAAEARMVVLVDGFIVTAALLAAQALYPTVLDYCLFAHLSDEQGHRKMLDYLGAKPLLSLGMRLGEGTGAAMAFPLVQSAINFLNEMASFESAQVSKSQ